MATTSWKQKMLAPALGLGLGLGISQVPKLIPQNQPAQTQYEWKVLKMQYRQWKEVQGEPLVCYITVRNNSGDEIEARSMGHFWDNEGEGACNVKIGDRLSRMYPGTDGDILYTKDNPANFFKPVKEWLSGEE